MPVFSIPSKAKFDTVWVFYFKGHWGPSRALVQGMVGYANSCLNPFVYIVLCETFRKRLVLSVKPAAQGQLRAVSNAQTADEERTESKGA